MPQRLGCIIVIPNVSIFSADFGFARHLYGADMAATLCGSPLYMVCQSSWTPMYNINTPMVVMEWNGVKSLRKVYHFQSLPLDY